MLETSRLKLVPLSHEQLLLFKSNPQELATALNINYIERQNDPAVATDIEEAIEFWIKSTAEHRDIFQWYTNWEIILKESNLAIGGVGFAGFPDEAGNSIVGYGLDIRFHGKGYATEALATLLAWGFTKPELLVASAETNVGNLPSQRVLIKNGFNELSRDETLAKWQLKKPL